MQTEIISSSDLEKAAQLLKAGELVAFPTETVYGLGAHAFQPKAIQKVFEAKGRPSDNPLIIHLSDISQIETVARDIPEELHSLAKAFWPGPLTVILKRHPSVPLIACAGLESVAVRIPNHAIAKELIVKVGAPLVAPSANLSGKPSATSARHVLEDFQGKIAGVIDGGEATIGIESTVVSLLEPASPLLLRPGSITKEDLERVMQRVVVIAGINQDKPISPGMKYRHYAPDAPIRLFRKWEELEQYLQQSLTKKRMLLSSKGDSSDHFSLSSRSLYALLRHADAEGYQEILVFCDEIIQNNIALMNRLKKAAS
jgi:L-threonylcarbamoyladenylate synthase